MKNNSTIAPKVVSPNLDKYVNRINIMQIMSFGRVSHYTMQIHIDKICDFYGQAVSGLTEQDLNYLKRALLDFYIVLGIYTPYNGFAVANLDKIPNSEWCTVEDFLILLKKKAFWKIFQGVPQIFNDIVRATQIIINQYYYRCAHTNIDIYELYRELDRDLFNN